MNTFDQVFLIAMATVGVITVLIGLVIYREHRNGKIEMTITNTKTGAKKTFGGIDEKKDAP